MIGDDFVVRNEQVVTDAGKRSSQDRSIRGYKKMFRNDPENAKALVDPIIRNTYRTLMTRGQKGCYIYCTDSETNEYFQRFVQYDTGFKTGKLDWQKAAEPDTP